MAALVQKSRKALRLYTSMGRVRGIGGSDYSEVQLAEWRDVSSMLIKDLTAVLEAGNAKKLAADLFTIRDRCCDAWREIEAVVHGKHKELVQASNSGDYTKAAILSKDLVRMKAKLQASQAAHHEIQEVIKQSKVRVPTIELTRELDANSDYLVEQEYAAAANVIPLRR